MKDNREKQEKMLEAMSLLDDAYVAEADPARAKPKRKWVTRLALIAACFCLMITSGAMWLFWPYDHQPPDVSAYADSEYYPIIQKLNAVTYIKPAYRNNFERYVVAWGNGLLSGMGGDVLRDEETLADGNGDNAFDLFGTSDGADMAPGAAPPEGATDVGESLTGSTPEGGSQYEETTDNQVAGVIEADLIKRTDKHIYYLRGNTLSVYSIEGEDSREISSFSVTLLDQSRYFLYRATEMYLSTDCRTVTVLAAYTTKSEGAKLALISLDVSNPEAIAHKRTVTLTGQYQSSRVSDGTLLLISGFRVGWTPDFSKESEFLPQLDYGDGPKSIPMKDIVSPEILSSAYYSVICRFDEDTLDLAGCAAMLSYSNTVYVSRDAIYVTRGYRNEQQDGNLRTTESMTEIARLTYGENELNYRGSVTVAGYVKDQYSLDEYERYLRVVTTTDRWSYREWISFGNASSEVVASEAQGSNASLYVIDLDSLTTVTAVEGFAPVGETVQSVRFDGTAAYVCTSVQLSDPVFFFDLSDLSHITVKDTGTIEGFSTSLVNFGDGYLLGIGRGNGWDTVKLEVYEESETGVSSVDAYEIVGAYYSTDYKSYLIDRENGLVGLGVSLYNSYPSNRYMLFCFDGFAVHRIVNCSLEGDLSTMRAVYLDGYLYLFSDSDFEVKKIS